MKKRIMSLFLVATLAITVFAGCSDQGTIKSENNNGETSGQEANNAESEDKYAEKITVSLARRGDTRSVEEDLFTPFLEEKFNLKLEVTDINNNDFVTKMNVLYASGEAPDVNTASRPEFMLTEWIDSGYLRGYTKEEVEEKFPNYFSQYTEEEWENIWPSISHSDDKTYYLPSRRADRMNMAWIYRADTFEELNLEFPESTDDIIEVMRTIKDETGRIPYVAASSGAVLWAFTGFLQAFGLPELAPRDLSYVDPISGDFIPYAFVTDNFREHIKFMNQLYEEGLIWKEFSTGTDDQVNAMKSQGHNYIQWGYPDAIEEYTRLSQNADPDAKWDWAKVMLSNDPEKGVYFKADPYYTADGTSFSVDADDKVIERFIDYMDWMHTEEGMVFRTYGIEGETYEKEGDNYILKEQMVSPIKSEGKTLTNYGFITVGRQHPNLSEYYKPYLTELVDTFMDRDGYYYHTAPIMDFTDEENSELADIATSLTQTVEENYAKFIMGQTDIEDDKDWDSYLKALEKLGLERLEEIRTEAYERAQE